MNKKSIRTTDILIEKVKRDIKDPIQVAHFHPYYEIGYLLNGNRQMTINESIYSMKKGDLVLVKKDDLHKGSSVTHKGESMEWIGMYFTEEYLEPFKEILSQAEIEEVFSKGVISIPAKRRVYVEDLFMRLIAENNKIDNMSDILVRCYMGELFALIVRCENTGRFEDQILSPDDKLMSEAAEYIFKNYYKNINLDGIAKKFNMSKSTFSKKFKSRTGCGFKEYLISVRIKKACDMLMETDKSITDIALDCGFSDSNYFGDAFSKVKGMSPHKYRKNEGMV